MSEVKCGCDSKDGMGCRCEDRCSCHWPSPEDHEVMIDEFSNED